MGRNYFINPGIAFGERAGFVKEGHVNSRCFFDVFVLL